MRECECWEPNIVSDGKGCRCSICDLPPRENDPDILRERIAELQKRIAELEAEATINNRALEMCSNECNRLYEDYSKQGDALAAQKADASAGLIEAAEISEAEYQAASDAYDAYEEPEPKALKAALAAAFRARAADRSAT